MKILFDELQGMWDKLPQDYKNICISAELAKEFQNLPHEQYENIIEAVVMGFYERKST